MNNSEFIIECIKTNKPIVFCKYGDGEYICVKKYLNNPKIADIVDETDLNAEINNCNIVICNSDRDTYTEKLSKGLLNSINYIVNQNNVLIGQYLNIDKIWEQIVNKEINWCSYEILLFNYYDMHDNIRFTNKINIYKAIKESKINKIIICNELLIKTKILLDINHIITIPFNSWFDDKFEEILDKVKNLMNNDMNIILTSCGMSAKVLIAELHKINPNNIYLDIGSGLDLICTKKNTRNFNITYENIYEKFKEHNFIPDNWNHEKYDFIYNNSNVKLDNNLKKTIIIQKHSLCCGGIGDFIRACLSFYSLSQRLNYDYYINFDENIYLKECFITPDIDINILNDITTLDSEEIVLLDGIYSYESIKPILDKINNNPKVYYLKSNAIGFESNDNIQNIKDYFFNNILKPSTKINNFINNIYDNYNIINNNYISVHVRCGDYNMQKNLDQNTSSIDKRINIDDDNIYEYYNKMINKVINKVKEDYKINLPVIIHSDSVIFKNKMKEINNEYIYLDLEIKHIAENIGNDNINSYISTISEFYIISKATKIILLNVYSGFSHIASIIENKELIVNFNVEYFNYLHANNIININ